MIARLALIGLMLAAGASQAAPGTSMKGWELYSWADPACSAKPQLHSAPNPDAVCYVLLPGTNRLKAAPEIKKAALKRAELDAKLATLAKGEELFWMVGDVTTSNQFDQPSTRPDDPRHELVTAIQRLGLKLTITPVPPNVGTITMAADGTVTLMLRSLPPGPIAETLVKYAPGDAHYKDAVDHVGGLKPGETKMLPPWP
jgi:hypothetical protein